MKCHCSLWALFPFFLPSAQPPLPLSSSSPRSRPASLPSPAHGLAQPIPIHLPLPPADGTHVLANAEPPRPHALAPSRRVRARRVSSRQRLFRRRCASAARSYSHRARRSCELARRLVAAPARSPIKGPSPFPFRHRRLLSRAPFPPPAALLRAQLSATRFARALPAASRARRPSEAREEETLRATVGRLLSPLLLTDRWVPSRAVNSNGIFQRNIPSPFKLKFQKNPLIFENS